MADLAAYIWVVPPVLVLGACVAVLEVRARRKATQKLRRMRELLSTLGPPRGPCLMHSGWTPYRPIIRIQGDQDAITAQVGAICGALGREMQGDRFGTYVHDGRRIPFGLVMTHRGSQELFIEIMKNDGVPQPDELELLGIMRSAIDGKVGTGVEILMPEASGEPADPSREQS